MGLAVMRDESDYLLPVPLVEMAHAGFSQTSIARIADDAWLARHSRRQDFQQSDGPTTGTASADFFIESI